MLVRADFNVTTGADSKLDPGEDYRVKTTIPTLNELHEKGAKVIILPRRGRDEDPPEQRDMAPVKVRLEELLGRPVDMLPNVREDPREAEVSEQYAKELAQHGDMYVNEAFGEAHRPHTSLTILPTLMPAVAGRRVQLEVEALSRVVENIARPYVVLASGAKLDDKIGMLRNLVEKADVVCIGGKIANVFLAASGKIPVSQFHADEIAAAQSLLQLAKRKLHLPLDIVTGSEDGQHYVKTISVDEMSADTPAWDIGAETVKDFLKTCQTAKTIVWNGPMGRCEVRQYCQGTHQLAEKIATFSAYRVVGGGDTVTALYQMGVAEKFDHVSVGGGAMIAFLEGKRMPALEPLYGEN